MTNITRTTEGSSGALARAGQLALAVLVVAALGACKRSALRNDDDRTQFSQYDRTRNVDSAPFIEDEFGRRTPNLRARLLVKD